jgi:uncharacterized protein (TIGR01244 family)
MLKFIFFAQISDELSIAAQVTLEQLQQAVQNGFKSVLNLRCSQEPGFWKDEQEQTEVLGLNYAHVPLIPAEADEQLLAEAMLAVEYLPKPILIHCASGSRASAIALIDIAVQENLTFAEVKNKAQEISLELDQPYLQHFLKNHL